ncbi:MAG: UDP-N-acetylglucosamine 1-carboxyvinyltransferase [Deltaproteobacteria bacterium]|nr:UDP-N-acetylglucosamine 1-carboxyvinyltransferase [Deltaproteobacteria bacterium]
MDKFLITGGVPLHGEVRISGAKNAALPLMAAALLTDAEVTLHQLPAVHDIRTMERLLTHLGTTWQDGQTIRIRAEHLTEPSAPYEIVKTMRASSLVLGPLLARCGFARVSLPGGCAIGERPLDLHLKALTAMGANIEIAEGYIVARAKRLRGAEITFDKVTVTGTENLMMAATLAEGTTVLHHAAREPEIPALAACLTQMGAQIEGAGTERITIIGVSRLNGTTCTIIPDRIETGTFMIAAAMTAGDVRLQGAIPAHVGALITQLQAAGATVTEEPGALRVTASARLTGVDCTTSPFPEFATDLQAQWMAAMTTARGSSRIEETVFENRFMHVAELKRLGADITVEGTTAIVRHVEQLHAAPVMATDLRASACLVLAGLIADGTTEIQRVYHLDRGYEHFEAKLRNLGARIERVHS